MVIDATQETSKAIALAEVAEAVRSYWGIENRQHRVLAVNMKGDASTTRKGNASQNLSRVQKIVPNLFRMDATDTVKSNLRLKRTRAAWDDELRDCFVGLTPILRSCGGSR